MGCLKLQYYTEQEPFFLKVSKPDKESGTKGVQGFLSPDPFVQNPAFSQDFNRYSYVNNNPMRFTDPSGYMSQGCGYNPTWKSMAWGVANQHAEWNAQMDFTYWRGDYVMGGFGGVTANYYYGKSLLGSGAFYGGIGGMDYLTEDGYDFLKTNYGVYLDPTVNDRGLGRFEQVSGSMIIGLDSEGNAIPNTIAISTVLCVWVPADLPKPEWNDVGWERPFENYGEPEPPLSFVGFNHGVPEFESSFMPNAYGVTPGPFVIYSKGHSSDVSLNTHEPGHVIQFFILGPALYYSNIAIPSLITVNKPYHNDMPWEKSANTLWFWLTGEKDESNPRYFEQKH